MQGGASSTNKGTRVEMQTNVRVVTSRMGFDASKQLQGVMLVQKIRSVRQALAGTVNVAQQAWMGVIALHAAVKVNAPNVPTSEKTRRSVANGAMPRPIMKPLDHPPLASLARIDFRLVPFVNARQKVLVQNTLMTIRGATFQIAGTIAAAQT